MVLRDQYVGLGMMGCNKTMGRFSLWGQALLSFLVMTAATTSYSLSLSLPMHVGGGCNSGGRTGRVDGVGGMDL